MNRYLKETLWFLFPVALAVLFTILLFGVKVFNEVVIDINVHDSYYVFSPLHFIITLSTAFLSIVYIARLLHYCFKNNKIRALPLIIFISTFISCNEDSFGETGLQNGDIIFQTSLSSQSKAIQLATNSKYSHCGIIFIEDGKTFVFEAIQPVKKTPLDKWITRGKDGHYVVKRLKDDSLLTSDNVRKMINEGKAMAGKNYDLYFEWSDDRIYCSELVWKIYKEAGIELSTPEKLSDFNLSHPSVMQKIKERYGNNIPMDEKVVSPATLYNSKLLETVIKK